MTREDLDRVTRRIAHEIVERNRGVEDLTLVGIHTRGKPFADRIAVVISDIEGEDVAAGSLDVGKYRDDLDTRPRERVGPTDLVGRVDGKTIVLTDDVLYTGRTVRAALDALSDLGRPAAVQVAVVVDRGHRQLPIRADFVGKNIPTSIAERISVRFMETDGEQGVWIYDEDQA